MMTELHEPDVIDVIGSLRDVNRGFKYDDGSVLMMRRDNRSVLILYDPIASVGMPEAAKYLCDVIQEQAAKIAASRE